MIDFGNDEESLLLKKLIRLSCPASGNNGRDMLLLASDFEDDEGIKRVGSEEDMVLSFWK